MSYHSLNEHDPSMSGFLDFLTIFAVSFAVPKVAAMFSPEVAEFLFQTVFIGLLTSYVRARKHYNSMFKEWFKMVFKRKKP